MPEISVVIPTRDRWNLLRERALASALAQEDVEIEILVVDDGSSDETPDRLAALQESRLRVWRNPESRGAAAARNEGIRIARGAWIAFLDDDDVWSPRKLRVQLDAAHASAATLVYAGVAVIDGKGTVLHAGAPVAIGLEDLSTRNVIPAGSSNVLVRSEEVRRVGGFDERLTYVADWDLWIRLAASGRFAVCPEILVGYVRDGGGMIFAGATAVREMQYFVQKHQDAPLRVDPARFLRWVASENRLAGRRGPAVSTYLRSGLAFRRPRHVLHAGAALLGGVQRRSAPSVSSPPRDPPLDLPWLALYPMGSRG